MSVHVCANAGPHFLEIAPSSEFLITISGRVFEDINYGGGQGRTYAQANASAQSSGWVNGEIGLDNVRIELYDASGNYLAFTNTDASGTYAFANQANGSYTVRAVNGTVTSNRNLLAGSGAPQAIQTFRSQGGTNYNNQVGGVDPTKADANSNSSATLASLTTTTRTAQSTTNVGSSTNISNVDFGFNFNTIVNTNVSGQGSLAQVILNCNRLANDNLDLEDFPTGGAGFAKAQEWDYTIFNIPGSGVHSIILPSNLPVILDGRFHLTGYTQAGATQGSNASRSLLIELKGTASGATCLSLKTDDVAVSGFIINNFNRAIYARDLGNSRYHIWGNILGINPSGTVPAYSGDFGIALYEISNSVIGTNGDGQNDGNEGNLISNFREGIYTDGCEDLSFAGNWIGLNRLGNAAIPNTRNGIQIAAAAGYCIIGYDDRVTQTDPAVLRNVISGNTFKAIRIDNSNAVHIAGNYIGLNVAGTAAIANGQGIEILSGSSDVIVGTNSNGTRDLQERNVISGNGVLGDINAAGIYISLTGNNLRTKVMGNYIGTDYTGQFAVPNNVYGIQSLRTNDYTQIGTDGDGIRDAIERNVVSGNNGHGIVIREQSFSLVAGNYVGVAADGVKALGNNGDGIIVVGSGTSNVGVGCSSTFTNTNLSEVGNIVRNNTLTGIHVTTGVELNNCLRNNLLGNNGELGIDIASKGVDSNDANDTDTGPNARYNMPIIESTTLDNNMLTIAGYVGPGSIVDFYIADSGPSPNPLPAGFSTSFGEGVTILGTRVEGSAQDADATRATYLGDGTGRPAITATENRFLFVLDVSGFGLTTSDRITAIATEAGAQSNTSEFSGITFVGEPEICDDGIDNDLDGLADCADPECTCYTISGRIFEDINYGGGPGRTYAVANTSATASGWAANAIGTPNARVELYTSVGTPVRWTLTTAGGAYAFNDLKPDNYIVRVVNSSILSRRASLGSGADPVLCVQTFKSDGLTDDVNEIGGADPSKVDADANTSVSTFSSFNTGNRIMQSVININLNADYNNVDFGFNFSTVVNTSNLGQGSLRQMIFNANDLSKDNLDQLDNPAGVPAFAKPAGWDHSIFMIAGAGVKTINLTSSLPTITEPNLHLTGYTASGASMGSHAARAVAIEITSNAPSSVEVIRPRTGNTRISGFAMYNVANGLKGGHSTSNPIHFWGNYVGLRADGSAPPKAVGGYAAVHLRNSNISYIGTDGDGVNDTNEGNVLSNSYSGVRTQASRDIFISGNYIGTNRTGTIALNNTISGINIENSTGVHHVGLVDNAPNTNSVDFRNVVSGNDNDGVRVVNSNGTVIAGNYLGTNAAGDAAIENVNYGVQLIGACSNTIIGTNSNGNQDAFEGNVMSGNGGGFRVLVGGTGDNTRICGNIIGLAANGTTPIGNFSNGIDITPGWTSILIGTDGDNNQDNLESNIISSNGLAGIRLGDADGHTVAGNIIGLAADRSTARGNASHGVFLVGSSTGNHIGLSPSMLNTNASVIGNTIHHNFNGVSMSGTGRGNSVRYNSFADNLNMAIDLGDNSVTINDNGDSDAGENDLYNMPVITHSLLIGNSLRVSGFARPGAILDFYKADVVPSPNPLPLSYTSSFGEGVLLLGSSEEGSAKDTDASTDSYTNDGSGTTTMKTENRFEIILDVTGLGLTIADRITATATQPGPIANSSEFSGTATVFTAEDCVNGNDDDGDGLIDECDEDCPSAMPVSTITRS